MVTKMVTRTKKRLQRDAVTPCYYWSGCPDSNRGPPAPKAGALPGCATPRKSESRVTSPASRVNPLTDRDPGRRTPDKYSVQHPQNQGDLSRLPPQRLGDQSRLMVELLLEGGVVELHLVEELGRLPVGDVEAVLQGFLRGEQELPAHVEGVEIEARRGVHFDQMLEDEALLEHRDVAVLAQDDGPVERSARGVPVIVAVEQFLVPGPAEAGFVGQVLLDHGGRGLHERVLRGAFLLGVVDEDERVLLVVLQGGELFLQPGDVESVLRLLLEEQNAGEVQDLPVAELSDEFPQHAPDHDLLPRHLSRQQRGDEGGLLDRRVGLGLEVHAPDEVFQNAALLQKGQVEHVRGPDAVGTLEELVVERVEPVRVLRDQEAGGGLEVLRDDVGGEHDDHLPFLLREGLFLERRAQERDLRQERDALRFRALVLGDQAADDERRVVGHPHERLHLPAVHPRRVGERAAEGADDRLDLHRHLGLIVADARAEVQDDAHLEILGRDRGLVLRRGGLLHRDLLADLDAGLAVVQDEHGGAGQDLRLPPFQQGPDGCLEIIGSGEIFKPVVERERERPRPQHAALHRRVGHLGKPGRGPPVLLEPVVVQPHIPELVGVHLDHERLDHELARGDVDLLPDQTEEGVEGLGVVLVVGDQQTLHRVAPGQLMEEGPADVRDRASCARAVARRGRGGAGRRCILEARLGGIDQLDDHGEFPVLARVGAVNLVVDRLPLRLLVLHGAVAQRLEQGHDPVHVGVAQPDGLVAHGLQVQRPLRLLRDGGQQGAEFRLNGGEVRVGERGGGSRISFPVDIDAEPSGGHLGHAELHGAPLPLGVLAEGADLHHPPVAGHLEPRSARLLRIAVGEDDVRGEGVQEEPGLSEGFVGGVHGEPQRRRLLGQVDAGCLAVALPVLAGGLRLLRGGEVR